MANGNIQNGIDEVVINYIGKDVNEIIEDNIAGKSLQGLRDDMIKIQGSTGEQITLTGGGATINTTELVVDSVDGKLYAYTGTNPTWVDNLGGAVDPAVWEACSNRELANKMKNLLETGGDSLNTYRKWDDGTLECFGRCICGGTGDFSKINTLPYAFVSAAYTLKIDADDIFLATEKRIDALTFAGSIDAVTSGHASSYYAIGKWE